MKTFKEFNLHKDIITSLEELGFLEPTPVQKKAIPFILNSKQDIIALAQTGTGKTAAFALPIIHKIINRDIGGKNDKRKKIKAIILCPTRELCLQVTGDIKKYSKNSKQVSVLAVYGGERIGLQINNLKKGLDIVVGTPGRMHDLIRRKFLDLSSIDFTVLDEADEMLDMGFKDDLDAILSQTPSTRQTLLFSATMSKSVYSIAEKYMNNAEEISIGEKNAGADNVSHEYYIVQASDRFETLRRILDSLPGVYGILFCRTKRETNEVADKLKQFHYKAEAINGDISQNVRTDIMGRFKKGHIRLLVATDVAARGIDVDDLSHVINYNLPDHNEYYTHRSGRTGRARKSGVSISIITPGEAGRIKRIESIIGKEFEKKQVPSGEDVCKKQIDNFSQDIEGSEMKEGNYEECFSEAIDKLKKIKKEDLIKHFIDHKFGHLLDSYKNSKDLNAKGNNFTTKSKEGVNLKINFGKKHGLEVKDLFGMINSSKHLKGIDIGRISLMPEYTVFSVEVDYVDDVMKCLSGKSFKGKKIKVEKSGKTSIHKNKRNNGANRMFRKKRGGYNRKKR